MNPETLNSQAAPTAADAPVPERAAGQRKRERASTNHRVLIWSEKYALLVILLVVASAFWVALPAFKSMANLNALAVSQSLVLVLAVGLIVPLTAGNFDLSIGAIASLSAIVAAKLMTQSDAPVLISLAIALGVALAVGVVNGVLVAYLNLDALIATLGTSIVLAGLISWATDDLSITGVSSSITQLASQTILGLPLLPILSLIIAAAVAYLLAQTPFGRRLTAIGSSRDAATLVGIRVRRHQLASFVVSGFLGGLAGIFLLAQQGSGNPAVNPIALILPALAAVYLGASAINPGQFNVTGTIIGLALVATLVSGLTLAGANQWVQAVVTGSALIVAVGTSTALRRQRLGA